MEQVALKPQRCSLRLGATTRTVPRCISILACCCGCCYMSSLNGGKHVRVGARTGLATFRIWVRLSRWNEVISWYWGSVAFPAPAVGLCRRYLKPSRCEMQAAECKRTRPVQQSTLNGAFRRRAVRLTWRNHVAGKFSLVVRGRSLNSAGSGRTLASDLGLHCVEYPAHMAEFDKRCKIDVGVTLGVPCVPPYWQ